MGPRPRPLRRLADRSAAHAGPVPFPWLPSPEHALMLFLFGTVLALSPLGTRIDLAFEVRLVTRDDGLLFVVMHEVLDRLSSQRVAGVALLALALWFAWRRRDLAPVVIAGLAETGFALAGVVKILLGKSATAIGTPMWWDDGLLAQGRYSMAYPSGHATEAVLLWGTVLLLLVLYAPGWDTRATRVAARCWRAIVVTTVVTSWAMHRHWVSDLGAGVVFGLLCLKLVVGLVERGVPQAAASLVQDALLPAGPRVREPGRDRP